MTLRLENPYLFKVKVACPHCSQHIEMDDSWFGKMLNCPNCRGIIDVPSKHTHDAMGAAMVPQRESPRTKRTIY